MSTIDPIAAVHRIQGLKLVNFDKHNQWQMQYMIIMFELQRLESMAHVPLELHHQIVNPGMCIEDAERVMKHN